MICNMLVVVLVACVFKPIHSDCTKPTRYNFVSNKNDLKNKRNCTLHSADILHKLQCMGQCAKRETCYNYQHTKNDNLCILCIDTLVNNTGLPRYNETQPSAHGYWEKEDIDDCLSSPCQNNGACVDKYYQHQCVCEVGFCGDNCETDCCDAPESFSPKWLSGGVRVQGSYGAILNKVISSSNSTVLYSDILFAKTMSVVDGLLWLPLKENKTIVILSPSKTEKVREIVFNDMTPCSLFQTGNNEVVLASTSGLYVINLQGSVLYKVWDGYITDIDKVNKTLVAYNSDNNSIAVVQCISGKWEIQTSFKASQSIRHTMNTVQITNNMIYLSVQRSENEIHSYSLNGQYSDKFAGNFRYPYLSGTNIQGELLVCDWNYKKLHLLSPSGQWQEYTIQGMRMPLQVLIDNTGNMWMLDQFSIHMEIRKYSV